MIVAIDGPAGAGKSTAARLLAERLRFTYLDTGAMYRALTWLALERGLELDDEPALVALAAASPVALVGCRVEIDGRDVTAEIRTARVEESVSAVSRLPGVRAAMRLRQRALAESGDSVVEGRDIGTHVCPAAEVKIYLVADPGERARRRGAERPDDDAAALAEQLHRRDERDAGQMLRAADAVEIDTTALTIDEVVERMATLVRERSPA
ncbi:MAG: (d)CMP kinase [Gaiellales bacterium]